MERLRMASARQRGKQYLNHSHWQRHAYLHLTNGAEVARLADFLVQLGKTEEAEERILDPRLHPAGTPLEVSPKELLDTKVQLEKTRRQIQDTRHQLLDLVIRMNQCCEKLRQRLCPPTTQTAEEQEIRKGCGISPDEVGRLAIGERDCVDHFRHLAFELSRMIAPLMVRRPALM